MYDIRIQSIKYDKDRSVVDVDCIIIKPIDKIVMNIVITPEDTTPENYKEIYDNAKNNVQ